jgi:hypothetical protein
MFGKDYKSWNPSLCNFLHDPVSSYLLGPNTFQQPTAAVWSVKCPNSVLNATSTNTVNRADLGGGGVNWWIMETVRYAVSTSWSQYITESVRHAVSKSCSQYVMQSVHHAVSTSRSQYVMQSVRHAVSMLCSQYIMQSVRHAISTLFTYP